MQQLITQTGSLFQIPSLISENGAKNALIVTGNHFISEPFYHSFTSAFTVPISLIHPPEGLLQLSTIPEVKPVDAVVAIGGGKTLDFAKGIIQKMNQPIYFIAVPTTAGSGSEATSFAVFYNGKEKISIDSPTLLPETTVLDARLVQNLPATQKAISGADAFAQCIESIWSVNSNADAQSLALRGLSILWKELPAFIQSSDEKIATLLLTAANLSGRAISHTRTTGPHALSYYLTAQHEVPHGQAVALFLPLFFIYNESATAGLDAIYKLIGAKDAEDACVICKQFFSSIGLATTFTELNLHEVNVDELLQSVNQQRFANNPVLFDVDKLRALIERYLF